MLARPNCTGNCLTYTFQIQLTNVASFGHNSLGLVHNTRAIVHSCIIVCVQRSLGSVALPIAIIVQRKSDFRRTTNSVYIQRTSFAPIRRDTEIEIVGDTRKKFVYRCAPVGNRLHLIKSQIHICCTQIHAHTVGGKIVVRWMRFENDWRQKHID